LCISCDKNLEEFLMLCFVLWASCYNFLSIKLYVCTWIDLLFVNMFGGPWKVPSLVVNEKFQCLVTLERFQAWWPMKSSNVWWLLKGSKLGGQWKAPMLSGLWKVPSLVANENFQCLVALERFQAWWHLEGEGKASFSPFLAPPP
jgi:hypothetical protein